MCGIGGKIDFDCTPSIDLGNAMNQCMAHRGPDAKGIYSSKSALLAHRRLSIIDLSESGNQPMANKDETIHIVFNGEIYNYLELRDSLSSYSFKSQTDTEVLLHLYEEYGPDCLSRLRGMFSFAIWDENKNQLFAAVDRLGQKPLYYKNTNNRFWFGSTIKTILADDIVNPKADLGAIRSYLSNQYVPRPKTGFQTIRRLEPGTYILVNKSGVTHKRYWSIPDDENYKKSASSLAKQLRSKLREATKIRMRSDVPLGVFLSGGLDSTITTYLMDDLSENSISTYSIGFEAEEYNELEFSEIVSSKYNTNHTEYMVSPESLTDIPELIEHYEMPFGDPSALPTYYVSKVASDDVTVALTGDAADEHFAGYDRYKYDRIATSLNKVPDPIRKGAESTIGSMPNIHRYIDYTARMLRAANGDEVERYAEFVCRGYGKEFLSVLDGSDNNDELNNLRRAFSETRSPSRLGRILEVDLKTYLPDDLLVKVDRASMAHSLETRSPFLDHKLIEFTSRIPSKYKYRMGKNKWLLRKAFKPCIPDEIQGRSKQGFNVPVGQWFRDKLYDDLREKLIQLGNRDGYNKQELLNRLKKHTSNEQDLGLHLWDLFMLENWYQRFIDSK